MPAATTPSTGLPTKVDSQPDVSTVVAVAIVAFLCASFIHEGIGHGLTSVIVGARVEMIASTFCQSADNEVSRSAQRAIQASGTLANVLFGTLFWILLRGSRRASAVTRLFLWLSMLLNLLQAAGYLAVPTLMGFGDWHEFLKGLAPSWVWRGSMIGIGTLLYPAFVGLGVYELEPLLGRKLDDRRHRLRRFTLIPYLTGGIAVCASGLMSPMGRAVIAISGAAATFGGASGLVWLPSWSMGRGADTRTPDGPPALTRSIAWQMLGAAGLVVLVYVLGRGIRFEP